MKLFTVSILSLVILSIRGYAYENPNTRENMTSTFQAGFAEINISPEYFPIRTYRINPGTVNKILDPIYARASIFSDGNERIAFLSLDVVIIEQEYADSIRKKASAETGIPESNIMVCATHNHACPAVVERASFKKEERYIDFMIEKGVEALKKASANMKDAEIGVASGFEGRVSFNRRFIKKDGTVISQPRISPLSDDILCNEGPIDPEVGVISVRGKDGKINGIIVNFASHACHHMGEISSGYPGVLCGKLREYYGDDIGFVFLNGACGNIVHRNHCDLEKQQDTKENTGAILAESVKKIIDKRIAYGKNYKISAKEKMLSLRYRDYSDLEECVRNPDKFVNVFENLKTGGWYRYDLERLKKLHSKSKEAKVSVMVFKIGNTAVASVPGEYFTELGLEIKEKSKAEHTYVVTLANGWLGYIPSEKSFLRKGGHETSTSWWSKMDYNVGNIIASEIVKMINE